MLVGLALLVLIPVGGAQACGSKEASAATSITVRLKQAGQLTSAKKYAPTTVVSSAPNFGTAAKPALGACCAGANGSSCPGANCPTCFAMLPLITDGSLQERTQSGVANWADTGVPGAGLDTLFRPPRAIA
jgi:hypothetical protein